VDRSEARFWSICRRGLSRTARGGDLTWRSACESKAAIERGSISDGRVEMSHPDGPPDMAARLLKRATPRGRSVVGVEPRRMTARSECKAYPVLIVIHRRVLACVGVGCTKDSVRLFALARHLLRYAARGCDPICEHRAVGIRSRSTSASVGCGRRTCVRELSLPTTMRRCVA
jgi:hypothetical protein